MIEQIEASGRPDRVRGAAGGAELHQAVQAALQHPPARRQVLSLHRDLARRGLPPGLLHPRAPPPRPRLLRALLATPSGCARRSRCSGRSSCSAPAPARAGPAQRLRPAWTTTSSVARRRVSATSDARSYRRGIDGVIDFLSGRYREIERDLEDEDEGGSRRAGVRAGDDRAQPPAGRALAARAPAGDQRGRRRRSTRSRWRSAGTDANAQVFQVRDGVLSDRQSFYLANETEREPAEVAEEFMLQYYGGQTSIPALVVVQRDVGQAPPSPPSPRRCPSARGGPVEMRAAERGEKRRMLELAERNATLALDQEQLRSERRRERRVQALDGLQRRASASTAPPMRIECFDISTLVGTNTVASMVVFEGGAPKKSDYRRFTIRSPSGTRSDDIMRDGGGARAPVRPAGSASSTSRPHDSEYDPSFAALPNLVVIDGGKGQLSAGLRAAARLPRPRAWRCLARQADRGGVHPRPPRSRSCSTTDTPELQLLAARARRGPPLRDHPPPLRRDRAMTQLAAGRAARGGPASASGRCWPTSARPTRCSPPPVSSSSRCPGLPAQGRPRPARISAPRGLSRENFTARPRGAAQSGRDGSLRDPRSSPRRRRRRLPGRPPRAARTWS